MTNNQMHLILSYCQEMKRLLQEDLNIFSENSFSEIAKKNEEKTNLLIKLSSLVDEAKSNPETTEADMKLIEQEIHACQQLININNNVIYSNLHRLKTIWDALVAKRPATLNTYNEKGKIT